MRVVRPRGYAPYPSLIRALRTSAPAYLCTLPIINTHLGTYAPYVPARFYLPISALRAFFCLVLLLQL